MTGIVWDGETLAADKQAVYGSVKDSVKKLFVVDTPKYGLVMLGMSGNLRGTEEIIEHLKKGLMPTGISYSGLEPNSTYGILIDSNKYCYDVYGDGFVGNRQNSVCAANGSAWEFLWACVACGKSAVEAMEIAIDNRTDVGLGVDKLNWTEVFEMGDIPF